MFEIKVADAIVNLFVQAKIPYIFGIAGTSILDLMDATVRVEGIEFLEARSEDNVAHMADGYARASGNIAVCTAHVGPGAVKLLYGIAAAYKDGSPMIAITGNEVTKNLGRDTYHEVDIMSIYSPVTKETLQITKPEEAISKIVRAMVIATSGKPGPVHLDIPKDIAKAEIDITEENIKKELSFLQGRGISTPLNRPVPDNNSIKSSIKMLKEAKYPLFFTGAGVIRSRAAKELMAFVNKYNLPFVTTDGGRGVCSEKDELFMGVVARQAGDKTARAILKQADLIVGIGLTFSDVSTFEWSAISEETKIIHVDINPGEMCRQYSVELPVIADAREYLKQLDGSFSGEFNTCWNLKEIKERLTGERESYYSEAARECMGVNPWLAIKLLNEHLSPETFISVDSGLHSFFGKKTYVQGYNTYIRSAGFGAMGFAIPGLLGALLAVPTHHAVSIMGDGCFAMVTHELETTKRLNLPITCMIFNNHSFGSQHYHQNKSYDGRIVGTEFNNPDFAEMAKLYGIRSWRIETNEELEEILPEALSVSEPTFLDIQIDPDILPSDWNPGSGLKIKK